MSTPALWRSGLLVALSLAAGTGCAGPGRQAAPIRDAVAAPSPSSPMYVVPLSGSPAVPSGAERHAEVVMRALSLLGVNYRFGGTSPESGLDCSGLVRHVFRETMGMMLPRRSEEISRAGADVGRQQLKPGDLVFFNTLRRAFSHVGIYIGNNQFVHAPSSGGQVRVETMDKPYWLARFDGARRMEPQRPTETVDLTGWRDTLPD